MEKENAKKIIEVIGNIDVQISSLTEIISDINDKEMQKRVRKTLAMVVGLIYADLIRPIIRDYPDLDPDHDKKA